MPDAPHLPVPGWVSQEETVLPWHSMFLTAYHWCTADESQAADQVAGSEWHGSAGRPWMHCPAYRGRSWKGHDPGQRTVCIRTGWFSRSNLQSVQGTLALFITSSSKFSKYTQPIMAWAICRIHTSFLTHTWTMQCSTCSFCNSQETIGLLKWVWARGWKNDFGFRFLAELLSEGNLECGWKNPVVAVMVLSTWAGSTSVMTPQCKKLPPNCEAPYLEGFLTPETQANLCGLSFFLSL